MHGAVRPHVVDDEVDEVVAVVVDQILGKNVVLGQIKAPEIVLVGLQCFQQKFHRIFELELAVGYFESVQLATFLDAFTDVLKEPVGFVDDALCQSTLHFRMLGPAEISCH